jgi:hypothetical protein
MQRRRSQYYVCSVPETENYTINKIEHANGRRTYSDTVIGEPYANYKAAKDALAAVELKQLKAEATKSKRGKTEFSNGEIPHLWMHKIQSSARNQQGTLFFEGLAIYSYGTHFPIAMHVTNAKGKAAVLYNSGSHSVTTSQHQHMVRSAIPDSVPVFTVALPWYSVRSSTHRDNLKWYQAKITEYVEKAARARLPHSREWNLSYAVKTLDEMKAYGKFFGVKVPKVKVHNLVDLDSLRSELAKKRAAEAKTEREAAKQRELEAIEAAKETIAQFRAGNPRVGYLYGVPVMLRLNGEEVETSRGARVPVAHAKRALQFIRTIRKRGKAWESNGHTFHVGHYRISKVAADGTLTAGCHVISSEEIDKFAPVLDAVQVPIPVVEGDTE